MFLSKKLILVVTLLSNSFVSINSFALDFSSKELAFSERYLPSTIESSESANIVVGALIASQLGRTEVLNKLYSRGNKLEVYDKLWIDQVIKACLIYKQNISCNQNLLIRKLRAKDSTNALPLVYSALFKSEQNELSAALKDLNEAASLTTYDDYYWKRFSLLLEKLKQNNYPEEHLYTASVKFAHNMVMQPYQEIMNLCNKQSKLSLEWRETCIRLGKLLEKKGNIFFANMVGFALQREALKIDDNDAQRLRKVKDDRETLNQWRVNAVKTLDFLEAQKKAPDSYYSDLVELGERKAIENALKLYRASHKEHNKAKQ